MRETIRNMVLGWKIFFWFLVSIGVVFLLGALLWEAYIMLKQNGNHGTDDLLIGILYGFSVACAVASLLFIELYKYLDRINPEILRRPFWIWFLILVLFTGYKITGG